MRIIDRFDKYMEMNELNDNQVTLSCGLSVGLLGKARSGKSDLGKKTIERILNKYQDLNRVWLLTGSGQMLNESDSDITDDDSTQISNDMKDNLMKMLAEALNQNSRLISVIEKMQGIQTSDSRTPPLPQILKFNEKAAE